MHSNTKFSIHLPKESWLCSPIKTSKNRSKALSGRVVIEGAREKEERERGEGGEEGEREREGERGKGERGWERERERERWRENIHFFS